MVAGVHCLMKVTCRPTGSSFDARQSVRHRPTRVVEPVHSPAGKHDCQIILRAAEHIHAEAATTEDSGEQGGFAI